MTNYRVYNNLIFLIPMVVGLYIQVTLFTILAVLIFLSSLHYHIVLLKHPDNRNRARYTDMIIAFVCYTYLSYFILYHKEAELQLPLFIGLLGTLFVFVIGKYNKSDAIHAFFHTSIAVTAGLIGLL